MNGELQGTNVIGEVAVPQAQRGFMASVYRWMFAGVGITGGVAIYTATDVTLLSAIAGWMRPLFFVQLAFVFGLSMVVRRLPAPVAGLAFIAYATLNGLLFSTLFLIYELGSIGQAFLTASAMFGAMSVYATFTKRDLSAWGTFLMMGLFGVVIASIVNIFWPSPGLSFVFSCAGVVVFAGLTAYDTQKLREASATAGYASVGSAAINGALALYLDFINLFLSLLRLTGSRR
jgi:FtsH-binding integral membrane protein